MLRSLSLRARVAIALVSLACGGAAYYRQEARELIDPPTVEDTAAPAQVTFVVGKYETAIMSGDGEEACTFLTEGARQELLASAARSGMGSDCASVGNSMKPYVDSLIARAPSAQRAEEARRMVDHPQVDLVSIGDQTATARIRGVSNQTIPLARTPAGWKISGFGS